MLKHLPTMWKTRVHPLGQEDLLEKETQPIPVFFPGKFHGWRSLVGYSPWGRNELDMTERLHFLFTLKFIAEKTFSLKHLYALLTLANISK